MQEDSGTLSIQRVLEEEAAWLGLGREEAEDSELAALCLSGGGIRSATFSLGVLQALARARLLGRFHYLSTVSGGGYIGSWLSCWMAREGQEAVLDKLAQSVKEEVEPPPVRRLRAYTNYLSPVWGLSTDFLALVATFVRNLALNWCVLLPLIAGLLLLPRLQLAMVQLQVVPQGSVTGAQFLALLALAALVLGVAVGYVVSDVPVPGARPGVQVQDPKARNRFVPACFIPVLVSAVVLSWLLRWDLLAGVGLRGGGDAWSWRAAAWFVLAGGLLNLGALALGLYLVRARGLPRRANRGGEIFATLFGGLMAGGLLYAAAWWVGARSGLGEPGLYATLSVPALLAVLWAGGTAFTGASSRFTGEEEREWWARATAWWLGAGVLWIVGHVLVIFVPRWLLTASWLQAPVGPEAAGFGAAFIGVVASAFGYWSKNGSKVRKHAEGILQALGLRLLDLLSLLFIVALATGMNIAISAGLRHAAGLNAIVAAQQANPARLQQAGWTGPPVEAGKPAPALDASQAPAAAKSHVAYSVVLEQAPPGLLLLLLLLLMLAGYLVSTGVGVNTFSLHSMYGNRLVRAYLGASNMKRRPHWFTGFDPDDNCGLADVGRRQEDGRGAPRRLFPVINSALNLVKPAGDRLEWQQRMAASFTMTPLHCGSSALEFVRTERYGSREGISLGRAMAISGAAASPNMGYHSSKLVAFVMTFFNVRLGWWMPNPIRSQSKSWQKREPMPGIKALLDEASSGTTSKHAFVHLSDGGHFENLGLYEMVRRGCTRIVVVDAGCDVAYTFDDLEGAIRKARVDFGVEIAFEEDLPTPAAAAQTGRHIARARITYPGGRQGVLVYLKPVLTGQEPLDVTCFAAANARAGKAFPHQPTSDQFFNESQFESYRMLGIHTVATHRDEIDAALAQPLQALEARTAAAPSAFAIPVIGGNPLAAAPPLPGSGAIVPPATGLADTSAP